MEGSQGNEELFHLFQKLGGRYLSKGMIFLSEPQRTKELSNTILVCIENNKFDEAAEAANLIDEPARTKMLTSLLKMCIESCGLSDVSNTKDIYVHVELLQTRGVAGINALVQRVWFASARKVADMIFENHQK